jgi:tetratricopeptide (TPR) repeat protein
MAAPDSPSELLATERLPQRRPPPRLSPGSVARFAAFLALAATPALGGTTQLVVAFSAAAALLVAWLMAPRGEVDRQPSQPLALAPIALLAGLALVQILPLPVALVKGLAPRSAELWALADAALREDATADSDYSTPFAGLSPVVSLFPGATEGALARTLLFAAFVAAGARFFAGRRGAHWLFLGLAAGAMIGAAQGVFAGPNASSLLASAAPVLAAGIAGAVGFAFLEGTSHSQTTGLPARPDTGGPRPRMLAGIALAGAIFAGLWLMAPRPLGLVLVALAALSLPLAFISQSAAGTGLAILALPALPAAVYFAGNVGLPAAPPFVPPDDYWLGGAGLGGIPPVAADSALAELAGTGGVIGLALAFAAWILLGVAALASARAPSKGAVAFAAASLFACFAIGLVAAYSPIRFGLAPILFVGLWAGAVAGRGAAAIDDWTVRIPAQRFAPVASAALLLAGCAWGAAAEFRQTTLAGAFVAATVPPLENPPALEKVTERLTRLRAENWESDPAAAATVGELWALRCRCLVADQLTRRLRLDTASAWAATEPSLQTLQVASLAAKKRTSEIGAIRGDPLVRENLMQARDAFRAALEASPTAADAALRLAELAFVRRDVGKNARLLDVAGTVAPGDADRAYRRGVQEFLSGRLERAIADWKVALEASPARTAEVGALLAGKLDDAKVLAAMPNAPEHLLTLAESVFVGEKHLLGKVQALEMAERSLAEAKLGPAETAFFQGRIQANNNRMKEAVESFRAAVGAAPEEMRYRHTLALALEAAGKRAEALAEVKECLAREPGRGDLKAMAARLETPPKPPPEKPKTESKPGSKTEPKPPAKERGS